MTHTPHTTTLTPERAANLAENPHAGQGSVLLDIGGDIGAVVLYLPADWEGAEIEYQRADGRPAAHDHPHNHPHDHPGGHRPHVAVVGRPLGERIAYSAVFPELVAGRYRFSLPDGSALEVDVEGGVVTELDRVGDGPVT